MTRLDCGCTFRFFLLFSHIYIYIYIYIPFATDTRAVTISAMSGSDLVTDVEKHPGNHYYEENNGAVPGETFVYGDSMYAKLQRFAGRFNVEQRGIERVPEDERTDTSYLNVGSMVRLT